MGLLIFSGFVIIFHPVLWMGYIYSHSLYSISVGVFSLCIDTLFLILLHCFLAQTPAQLRIVPGHTMLSTQVVGTPIEKPIQVELLDVNGRRVTSGPDSELVSI